MFDNDDDFYDKLFKVKSTNFRKNSETFFGRFSEKIFEEIPG